MIEFSRSGKNRKDDKEKEVSRSITKIIRSNLRRVIRIRKDGDGPKKSLM